LPGDTGLAAATARQKNLAECDRVHTRGALRRLRLLLRKSETNEPAEFSAQRDHHQLSQEEIGMRRSAFLICAAVLAVLGIVTAVKAVAPASSTLPRATISIQDLHCQIDAKSLPELKIESLY
jgi:hypothetical protein